MRIQPHKQPRCSPLASTHRPLRVRLSVRQARTKILLLLPTKLSRALRHPVSLPATAFLPDADSYKSGGAKISKGGRPIDRNQLPRGAPFPVPMFTSPHALCTIIEPKTIQIDCAVVRDAPQNQALSNPRTPRFLYREPAKVSLPRARQGLSTASPPRFLYREPAKVSLPRARQGLSTASPPRSLYREPTGTSLRTWARWRGGSVFAWIGLLCSRPNQHNNCKPQQQQQQQQQQLE